MNMTTGRFMAVRIIALIGAAALISGCSSLNKSFGIGKFPPDEFAIVTKAPLVIPPDFSLRPPAPGQQRPQELNARERAQAALYGSPELSADTEMTDAERVLAIKAGAQRANPDIKALLNTETGNIANKSDSFTDLIMFWQGPPTLNPEEPLDPQLEEERLRYWELARAAVGDAPIEIRRSKILNLPGVR